MPLVERRQQQEQRRQQMVDQAKELAQEKKTAISRISRGLLNRRLDAPHVCEVADEMLRRFGSVQQFTVDWKRQLDRAETDGKTSMKTILDGYRAIFGIFSESTKYRDSAPDVTGLTDEEIEQELKQAALNAIAANPDALAELAEQMGLKLVRVDDPRVLTLERPVPAPVEQGGHGPTE